MGLSSFKFSWWAPKDACVLKQCIMGLQGHPKSLILALIENAYATSYWSSIGQPRDAATVLFGLKFADDIHYKFKSSQASKARLQSSKHTDAKQNLTQNDQSRSFKVRVLKSVERRSRTK